MDIMTEPFCSYCNKILINMSDDKVVYKVALYLQTEDSVVQVCYNCAVQVFVKQFMSESVDIQALIDICDNILLRN